MAQTGKIYSSYISNILNNLQGEASFTVEDNTTPIFDTLFSQNAFNSIPEGSTISKIEIKFQSKINQTASRYKAQWSIYDVGYPLDWDGNYTGYTNLPKYQSTWISSSKMNLLTNTYQPFTCTINNPSLDAIRTGLMVRTRVTYEDTGFLGRSSTVYIKDFHVIAYYTPPTYTVSFNGNGATSGSVSSLSKIVGEDFSLPANGFEKKYSVTLNPNYSGANIVTAYSSATFNGWEDHGTITAYTGEVFSKDDFDAPFYSNTYNDLYKVYKYNKQGLVDHYVKNGRGEGRSCTGNPRGVYPAGAMVSNLANGGGTTTLYAQWSEISSVEMPTLTRDGHTFLGWYTAESGGTKVGDGGDSYTPIGNITLYAHWKTASTNMIYIGTKQPTFYIGTRQVQSIYLGTSLIYEVVLPKISYDSIKTFGNLLVPSPEDTPKTYTLPPANLENAEGNISYALYSDSKCTTSVGTGITFDENTRQVTISNAAKDTVATQDTDKDGLAKFYVKATYESLSAIGEITLENYKVTATFSYLNKEDTYVDKTTEVYYGTSVEEFANGITDYKLPENDKNCHYINNGWVDFLGKSTLQRVLVDTTFVISVSSEPHDIDPTIAGYDKKDPTCTEAGYTKGYCRYCAEQEDGYKGLIQVEIPATGHTDTNDDNICDVCGERIAEIVDSGTCGDNLTYTLDSNGVLTISGTGDMQNSSFGWDKDLIKSVVINDGVTSIGQDAFYQCTNLTSVTIPGSVISIGNYAFQECASLTSITIPNSVTSIGRNLFFRCIGLTSVTIGNSVTSIGDYVFNQCKSLTSITIPDSVTSIGISVFGSCSNLTEVDFSACTDIPTLNDSTAFSGTPESLVIKVPSSLVDEWKAATNWVAYADKIVGVRL